MRAAWLAARRRARASRSRCGSSASTLTGRFADLDDDGALLLEIAERQRRRIAAGEVFFPGLG